MILKELLNEIVRKKIIRFKKFNVIQNSISFEYSNNILKNLY
jgi:hypothetical protein